MDINKAKILICDDSILARKQLKDVIFTIGQPNVFEAKDGSESVELYKKEQPDLVFLDIVMPKFDGKEVLKQILDVNANAKIVIVSSIGTREVLLEAIKLGAIDFIQKPFTELQIINAISKSFS